MRGRDAGFKMRDAGCGGFMTYARAFCDEMTDHRKTSFEIGSLAGETLYRNLHDRLDLLGKMLYTFIQGIEREHRSVKEEDEAYTA